MRIEVLRTDGFGLEAEVRVGDETLVVMDGFSSIPTDRLDFDNPEFECLTLDGLSWDAMFSGNPNREKKLVSRGGWAYDAYGQIVSIQPVIADFGLLRLDLGDFTRDERCVGEWILERLDRLELTFRTK